MTDIPSTEFAEPDEELFQKVRNELLGKPAPVESVPLAVAEPQAPVAGPEGRSRWRWVWPLLGVIALLTVMASGLSWLLLDSSGPTVALMILSIAAGAVVGVAVVVVAMALARLIVQTLTPKRSPQSTPLATSDPDASPVPIPPAPATPWRTFLISLIAFVLLGALALTPVEMAWLLGVLLLHESGHFFGMRYFGYRDVRMFFIPLFGAAVRGEKKGVPAWQEAIVLLLGPLPGLLLGCAIYFVDLVEPQPFLRAGASWLVVINFLNLLPLEPLDGGRLCNRLLFSRYRWLEAATVVLATLGLVLVCWGPGWICLGLAGAFALFVLAPARYKAATASMALQSRWPALPVELAELSEPQWRDLYTTTRGQFTKSNVKLLAAQMKNIHQRALERPESGRLTLALFSVYLAALLLGVVTASVTRLNDDAGQWPIRRQMTETADPVKTPKE